jgi:hypothetical protein
MPCGVLLWPVAVLLNPKKRVVLRVIASPPPSLPTPFFVLFPLPICIQDKILQSYSDPSKMHVTNDGATILKAIGLDNPAAKVLVEISKVQDDEVGDGTTSVTVLAAELLREAEKLIIQKIHPQTAIAGYRKAGASTLP